MSIESLKNQGFSFSVGNPSQESQKEKTFVVVGVARGGTSIIAGTLAKLGVFMGNAQAPVYEDLRLSLAYEKTSQEKFETVVADYNEKYNVWGWKRPSTLNDLPRIAKKLRNPHFIFVFRDLLSVANRNVISMKHGLESGLSDGLKDYAKIIKFIGKKNYPAFYISSEKTVSNKEPFLEAISKFCQLSPTEKQKLAVYDFISPNPEEYLDKTRIDRVVGWVDKWQLQAGILKGWAHYPSQPDKKAEVQILVNGEIKLTVCANRCVELEAPRFEKKARLYGFELDLRDHGVMPQDNIQFQVEGAPTPFDSVSYTHLTEWITHENLEKQKQPKWGMNTEFITTGILRGWATARDMNKPASILVIVNEQNFAVIPASIFRAHLKKPEIHPTGECGFELNLKQLGVKPADTIQVLLEEDKTPLHKEVITFPELDDWITQKEWQDRQKSKKTKKAG